MPLAGGNGAGGACHPGLAPLLAPQAELAQRWGAERAADGLDAALAAELLELLEPASTADAAPAGPPGSAPRLGSEDEAAAAAARAAKRKRCSAGLANKELAKRRERANEQRVLELTARNERLREDIRRLSAEVERTRAALIQRIVNLRRA